jgi:ABC-2 type transport system ATP-binding protein
MPLLTLNAVTKRYGSLVAVDSVSFEAQPGRILGLLGPNGAGKTSTIRMIAYITAPDEGSVLLDGQPVGAWSQARMGYLPEERGLYKKLRVEEQLQYLGQLKGLSRAEATAKSRHWLRRFEAADLGSKKTEELSKGMQQKVQFISSILHDPALVILDEPFSGLDPLNSELLRDIILELRANGCTTLFASHRMEQVEQICDDICLISAGKIVLQGPLREIKRSFGRDTIIIEFDGDAAFLDEIEEAGLARVGMRSLHRAELRLARGTSARSILELTMSRVEEIYRFELVEPPLNEIFVSVVGGAVRKDGPAVAAASSH